MYGPAGLILQDPAHIYGAAGMVKSVEQRSPRCHSMQNPVVRLIHIAVARMIQPYTVVRMGAPVADRTRTGRKRKEMGGC